MIIDKFLKNSKGKTEKSFKNAKNSDKPLRSIVKSVSWRIVGTLDTIIISWIITGKITMALTIGSIELITKMIYTFFTKDSGTSLNGGNNEEFKFRSSNY